MIENFLFKNIINIALILITILFGIVLHKTGRPYNVGIFTIHKLTTVALVFFVVRMIISFTAHYGLNLAGTILIIISAILILGLVFSGGVMSLGKSHNVMLSIHRIVSIVFLLVISMLVYVLFEIKRK